MQLLYSPASPYAAKVRMAARHLGIELSEIRVDTTADPAPLTRNNPLGKIPTLLLDDSEDGGGAIYDSVAIMHYLDRISGGGLYPKKHDKRTQAEVLEALCDGITDCLIAIVYERRFRPEEKIHQPWIDRQWQKVERGLDHLNAGLPKTGKKLHGGHFALAAMIAYLDLRFAGEWTTGRTALSAWTAEFSKRFKDYAAMRAAS